MNGTKRPAAHSTGYGIDESFGGGAPTTDAKRVASARTVSGGFVGVSQALPQARASVAAVTSARAASAIVVQLCGTSSAPGTKARLPALMGLASTRLRM